MVTIKSILIIRALALVIQTSAFSTYPSSPCKHQTSESRRLYAHKQADEISRRDAIQTATAAAAFVTSSTLPVNADEGGKLIEFTVDNLDGKEGETGVFVIKTKPDWAPIGAERFEVGPLSFEMPRVFI